MNRVKSKLSDPVDPVVTRNFCEYCDPVDPVQAWYTHRFYAFVTFVLICQMHSVDQIIGSIKLFG